MGAYRPGMIVIVGHGPSVVGRKLGRFIDDSIVIRLKGAPKPNAEDWGTRTDYVSTTRAVFVTKRLPCEHWIFGKEEPKYRRGDVDRWLTWFHQFTGRKPSNGLCAAMMAVQFLQPARLGVIGFDSIMHPNIRKTGKWNDEHPADWWHDQHAEHKALHSLGMEIVDLCSPPRNT